MLKLNKVGIVALVLTLIGALNWGLVGLFGLDLVAFIFGEMSIVSRLVYSLVGVSAIILVIESIASIETHRQEPHAPHPV